MPTRARKFREEFTVEDVRKLHDNELEDGTTEEEIADLEWWTRDQFLALHDGIAEAKKATVR